MNKPMTMSKTGLFALTAWLAFAAPVARAELYQFSYTRNNNEVIAGQLNGTLQADNNVVVVTGLIGAPRLNGIAGPLLPFVSSTDVSNFGTPGLLPRVSLNGSFMDIIVCNMAANCSGRGDAFTFNAGNASAAAFGPGGAPFAAYDGFFGAYGESYSAARWVLSPVPEPGTSLLTGAGVLVAMVWVRSRGSRSVGRGTSPRSV